MKKNIPLILSASALAITASASSADQVFLDDLIVEGSACIGIDCSNGENFGFDTIRLKENNLRIKAQDTSTSASFPTVDWQITFNDSGNGGANKFSIDDIDNSVTPFTIEASSIANALYVDDQGDVGVGTSTPVVEVHAVDGNTPTFRLEQNGSSGFTPQTWDLAGNETNFFVRDVTNGSKLPFRIEPGAPDNVVYLEDSGDVGMGTNSPDAALHVRRTDGTAQIHVEETSNTGVNNTGGGVLYAEINNATAAPRTVAGFENFGDVEVNFINTNSSANTTWKLAHLNDMFQILSPSVAGPEFQLDNTGNLVIAGTLTTGSNTAYPDYVFEDDYELMPLAELNAYIGANGHLPKIPKAEEVAETGINITEMQVALLEKVEELTLYTLQQQARINALESQLSSR